MGFRHIFGIRNLRNLFLAQQLFLPSQFQNRPPTRNRLVHQRRGLRIPDIRIQRRSQSNRAPRIKRRPLAIRRNSPPTSHSAPTVPPAPPSPPPHRSPPPETPPSPSALPAPDSPSPA